ncbi:MAG TPA: hypothetical protein VMF11_04665 [Candidatus Baltobacteraceae bacterium]|nr:hypothetical protein [Candidatus Baltobacteraceae bacterium]
MRNLRSIAVVLVFLACAAAPPKGLVLVPFEEPNSTDPHAAAVTEAILADFAAAGMTVPTVAPIDHIDAVSTAAKICATNNAWAVLIPDGRSEQTMKRVAVSFVTVLHYPTHVELRLDVVGCNGRVLWSTVTTGDQNPGGVYSVGNLGAAVDAAFASAAQEAVQKYVHATIPESAATGADPSAAPVAQPASGAAYLLLPVGQPGIADPRADDITHSLAEQMQQRKLEVKVGASIDHLSAVTTAPQLCSANGVQGIVVPTVRIEQSGVTGASHAVVRLALLDCSGAVSGHGYGDADLKHVTMVNFGAAAVEVSERAMGPALDQLFPATKS